MKMFEQLFTFDYAEYIGFSHYMFLTCKLAVAIGPFAAGTKIPYIKVNMDYASCSFCETPRSAPFFTGKLNLQVADK
jgi:hypothetical protein